MLPADRLLQSIACWDILDELAGGPGSATIESLKRIVSAEVRKQKARDKSITLAALLDDYISKLKLKQRTDGYIKQFSWLRGIMDIWLETKVSDLTPGNIRMSLQKLPSGYFNSNLVNLRAVLNYGVDKLKVLRTNPAKSVDFIHRPKVEVKCLPHQIVEKMFRHAQEHIKELIPPYVVGFFCGVRESELRKLHYSDIRISDSEKFVIVPASISKVKRKRIIPLSDNAIAWMQWYFNTTSRMPDASELLMSKWSRNALKMSRQANYEAAAGQGAKWQQNCKRHAFSSHYAAAYPQNLEYLAISLMGHTDTKMTFERYAHAVSHEEGVAYWEIRP